MTRPPSFQGRERSEDFKRLFTLSEYYDRDRNAFYQAIRSVRELGMDLTGWLEFFVSGLATQLAEVKARGEAAIKRDVVVKIHRLNPARRGPSSSSSGPRASTSGRSRTSART